MKLTQEEFDLLLRIYLDNTMSLMRKEKEMSNDVLIRIEEKHLNDKLKNIRKTLIFIDKIKAIDIDNVSDEDILSFIGNHWSLYRKKKIDVTDVLKDVSEEIQGYADDKYLHSLNKYKALLEKIANQTKEAK